VIEVALVAFAQASESEREKLIRRHHAGKRAATRDGWMAAFWDLLGEELGVVDFAHGNADRCMVDRTHAAFGLVFLSQSAFRPDSEQAGFTLHVMERPPIHNGGTFPSRDIVFARDTPVDIAATQVATWISEHQGATKA
jgi:hypothetical protein